MKDDIDDEPDEDIIINLLDEIMACQFTEQQRRILDLIIRLSFGCGKEEAYIPLQKDFELVGVRQSHVGHHLDWLNRTKVISKKHRSYKINLDFEKWRVSKSLFFDPERLEDLIELNTKGKQEFVESLEDQCDPPILPPNLRKYLKH